MFGIIGRVLSAPVKIANIPLKAADVLANAVTDGNEPIFSRPLDDVAQAIDDAADDLDD